MSQTSVSIQAPLAFAGLLADGPGKDMFLTSLANEDTADAVFGLGYALGTNPETQFEAFAAADTFAGVLAHRHQTEQRAQFGSGGSGGATGLKTGEVGDLVRRGRIWVVTNELVVAGEAAFVVNAVADFGQWRNDATNAQAVAGVFRRVASATLAELELNEP